MEEKNKIPAFQFYPAEFLADENVMMMNNRELGCYIRLMCYCWREGSIPNDIQKMAKLCLEDSSTYGTLWPAIEPCFKKSENDPTRLVNKRLEQERIKQLNYKKVRSEAGQRGANLRWKVNIAKPCDSDSQANVEPMAKNASLSSNNIIIKKENIKRKKDSEPKNQTEFILPDWLLPFQEDWNHFLEMRIKIRKPATFRAKELLVSKLEGFKNQGFNLGDILKQSIRNDWQDLFEPKQQTYSKPQTQFATPSNPDKTNLLPDAIKAKNIKRRRDKYGQTLETGQELWLKKYEEQHGVVDING